MSELYPGYDMMVAIGNAIGWLPDVEDSGTVRGWETPDGYLLAPAFDPQHSNVDALAALDTMLKKRGLVDVRIERYKGCDGVTWECVIPHPPVAAMGFGFTLSVSICAAIQELAAREQQHA